MNCKYSEGTAILLTEIEWSDFSRQKPSNIFKIDFNGKYFTWSENKALKYWHIL